MEIVNTFLNIVLVLGFIFAVYYFYAWIKSHVEAKSMKETKRNIEDKAFFEANLIIDKFIIKRQSFLNTLDKNEHLELTSFFERFIDKKKVVSFDEKIKFLNKIDELNVKFLKDKMENNHD